MVIYAKGIEVTVVEATKTREEQFPSYNYPLKKTSWYDSQTLIHLNTDNLLAYKKVISIEGIWRKIHEKRSVPRSEKTKETTMW